VLPGRVAAQRRRKPGSHDDGSRAHVQRKRIYYGICLVKQVEGVLESNVLVTHAPHKGSSAGIRQKQLEKASNTSRISRVTAHTVTRHGVYHYWVCAIGLGLKQQGPGRTHALVKR
jgi:hypothetical protein